jgi:hypothetical protein
VRRLRTAAAVVDEAKLRSARREGFWLHANVALPAHAREPLEHLCRHLLRPPLATDRLTGSSGGRHKATAAAAAAAEQNIDLEYPPHQGRPGPGEASGS